MGLEELIGQYEQQLEAVKRRYYELLPLYGENDRRTETLQCEWWDLCDAIRAMRRHLP